MPHQRLAQLGWGDLWGSCIEEHPHPSSAKSLRSWRRYPPRKGEGGWWLDRGQRTTERRQVPPSLPSPSLPSTGRVAKLAASAASAARVGWFLGPMHEEHPYPNSPARKHSPWSTLAPPPSQGHSGAGRNPCCADTSGASVGGRPSAWIPASAGMTPRVADYTIPLAEDDQPRALGPKPPHPFVGNSRRCNSDTCARSRTCCSSAAWRKLGSCITPVFTASAKRW